MKIFLPPEHIVAPEVEDFMPNNDFDDVAYNKAVEDYITKVKEACKAGSNCPDAGKEIWWPMCDGKARYIVFDYKELWHLPIGDAYEIDDAHARGLRKRDILQRLEHIAYCESFNQ